MAMDKLKFEASHPTDIEGEEFEHDLLVYKSGPPIRRTAVHDVIGGGHTVHYLGPGGRAFRALIRVSASTYTAFEDAYDNVLNFLNAFGTITVTPGVGETVARNADSQENVLLRNITPLQEASSPGEFSVLFQLDFLQCRIVGVVE